MKTYTLKERETLNNVVINQTKKEILAFLSSDDFNGKQPEGLKNLKVVHSTKSYLVVQE